MSKRTPPHMVQLQAEGSAADRALIKEETYQEAKKLADKMPVFPPDKLIYVRNLTQKVLRQELDLEVFKLFVKMTGSYVELQTCAPRAKMLSRR